LPGVYADALGDRAPLAATAEAGIEMDVGDERDGNGITDRLQRRRRLHIRHRHPDQVAAGGLEPMNLGHRGLDIGGEGIGHRLDRHRVPVADSDRADGDLSCLTSTDHG